jgi:phosphoglycerol transferase
LNKNIIVQILFGSIIIIFVTGLVFYKSFQESFDKKAPIGYDGDSLAVLASIKAVGEGGINAFKPIRITRLNAPEEALWSDVPISEFCFLPAELLLNFTDLFTASTLFVGFGFCSAALAFYLACLWMGYAPVPSAALAVLYGVSPYAFARNLEHVILTLYFVVPLYLLCALRIWGKEGEVRSAKEVSLLAGIAFVCSLFNPYYWAMFLILLGFVLLGHVCNKSLRGMVLCVVLGVAAVVGFIFQNIDSFYFRFLEGSNPSAVTRDLWWMVKFGLFLPDMVLPKFHSYPVVDFIASKNYHWKIPEPLQGESQTAYIGIIAVIGLGILLIGGFARASAGKLPQHPALFWFAVVVFAFALVGGINYFLGAFGFQFLRASNRYSIYLSAIGLFYLSFLISRFGRQPVFMAGLCAVILPLGVYDQVPKIPQWLHDRRAEEQDRFRTDREFFPEMERRLPEGGLVFQFPVHGFPESGPVHEMGDYEHFRPYLHTKGLRFSYGTVKGREGSDWQAALATKTPEDVRKELVEREFGYLLINRRAYRDRGEDLKNQLLATGMGEMMQNLDFFVLEIQSLRE